MHQYKQFKQTACTGACNTYCVLTIYDRLPIDEPSGLKYVGEIKKNRNQNINLENMHFVGLCCITNIHTCTFSSAFGSQHGQEIFLFSKTSRRIVGPTQPPINVVPCV
jgi:hypothetical protein